MSETQKPAEPRGLNGADINYDDVFSALSTPRSRCLFAHLKASDTPVALEDVARDVAAWELGCDRSEISEETEQKILISLYHSKAPKLADAGLVDFDADELTIEIAEAGAQFEGQSWLPVIE